MRTKALLLGAMIGAASLTTSMAQVYSVNIVGYVNLTVYQGWNLLANQLNNSGGNTVGNLIPTAPGTLSVFTYDAALQGYRNANFDAELGWDTPELTINPGQGFFLQNQSGQQFTLTLVGEVQTGTSTIPLYTGWQLLSVVVPQGGLLADDGSGLPHMGYVPSSPQDSLFSYEGSLQGYRNFNFDSELGWDTPPTIEVGRGFFALRTTGGSWARTFNVGP